MKNYKPLAKHFFISTNKSQLNVDFIHQYLCSKSYWAKDRSIDVVKKSIKGSVCFGVYKKLDSNLFLQIGFARVITDKVTFGYLADVFIVDEFKGIGLGKWLIQEILTHKKLQGFKSWVLATKNAHGLYASFGFKVIDNPERFMQKS